MTVNYIAIDSMVIYFVDLPIDSMVIFHSYVNVLPEGTLSAIWSHGT